MSSSRFPQLAPALLLSALGLAACAGNKRVDEGPMTVMRNGDRVQPPTRAIDAATTQALEARVEGRDRRDSITAAAFAGCAPTVCAALGRGEVALGMTSAQVMAATRTTEIAWTSRAASGVTVLTPRDADAGPRDAVASVVLVQLASGHVASITYREPEGLRTVSSAADVSGVNLTRSAALVREGNSFAAAGDFTHALERYDRASVVSRADGELQYKIATSLDKLLRPQEAAIRYRLFLHQLELERIGAYGDANAKMADAIAQARQRVIVQEKKST